MLKLGDLFFTALIPTCQPVTYLHHLLINVGSNELGKIEESSVSLTVCSSRIIPVSHNSVVLITVGLTAPTKLVMSEMLNKLAQKDVIKS